jgi:hypothetical protein
MEIATSILKDLMQNQWHVKIDGKYVHSLKLSVMLLVFMKKNGTYHIKLSKIIILI